MIVLVALGVSAVAVAEEVTIDELLAKVPVLSPNNEELNSFQFTAELPTPFGFLVPLDVGWTRPDDFGMSIVDPASRTPVGFLAEKQLMLYDAAMSTVWLDDDAVPRFVLRADADNFTINYGFSNDNKTDVTIDLPSLFRNAGQEPKLTKLDDITWQVTMNSKSGKSQIAGKFDPARPWPLLNVEIRSVEGDSVLLAVRNISINERVAERLRSFPSPDHFPPELRVQRFSDAEVKPLADGLNVVFLLMRAIGGQAAIRNATMRDFPFFNNVDWDLAALTDAVSAPALRSLLKIPADDPQSNSREE